VCVDLLNRPENLEKQRAENVAAWDRLAQYRATDPMWYARFERHWNDAHFRGSVPTVLRKH
jgi:hypothetical protein